MVLLVTVMIKILILLSVNNQSFNKYSINKKVSNILEISIHNVLMSLRIKEAENKMSRQVLMHLTIGNGNEKRNKTAQPQQPYSITCKLHLRMNLSVKPITYLQMFVHVSNNKISCIVQSMHHCTSMDKLMQLKDLSRMFHSSQTIYQHILKAVKG